MYLVGPSKRFRLRAHLFIGFTFYQKHILVDGDRPLRTFPKLDAYDYVRRIPSHWILSPLICSACRVHYACSRETFVPAEFF